MELPPITRKQLQILLLLYSYRFLNRQHIQTILKHKDPHRIKSWLTDLTQKEYLNRIYSKTFPENTKPAIYHLNLKSKKILEEQPNINTNLLKRIYREKIRSRTFIDHHLSLADTYITLLALERENNVTMQFFPKTLLADHRYLLKPLPDAYFVLTDPSTTKRYFIETLDDQMPRFAIRNRIQQYVDYADSREWESHTKHPFPAILFVCPNVTLKKYVQRFITQTLEEDIVDLSFHLTTPEEIKQGEINLVEYNTLG